MKVKVGYKKATSDIRVWFRKDQSWLQVSGKLQPVSWNTCQPKPPFCRDRSFRMSKKTLLDRQRKQIITKRQNNTKTCKKQQQGNKGAAEHNQWETKNKAKQNWKDNTIHENIKNYFHKMIFGTILFSFWFPNCILHPKDEIWGFGGGNKTKLKIGVLSCTTTTLMSSVDSLLLSD